jgi:glycosyltransferase involved in cell wall biosynthesis
MTLPSFSIIIPAYSRPGPLSACLEAIAHLDYPLERFEVIVIDDGSSMPLDGIVASFSSRIAARCLRQQHAGPAAARNKGAMCAQGEFLVFTDDDCLPHRNWLRSFAQRFVATPHHLIGGRTLNALPDNLYSATSQAIIEVVYEHFNAAGEALFFASNNFAVPAETFRQVGGFNEDFFTSEDREFCDRWSFRGYGMSYAPDAVICHAHPLSLGALWRQHFGYGRGAFRFHRARRLRTGARINPDRHFYFQLLRYPSLTEQGFRAVALTLLVGWTQLASTAGLGWEMITHRAQAFSKRTQTENATPSINATKNLPVEIPKETPGLVKSLTTTRGIVYATGILLLLFLLVSFYRAYPYVDNVNDVNSAGNDWLTYKKNALSILHDGVRMPAVNKNYHLPGGFLYNYFVAAVFALFGENSTYVYLVQAAMLAISVGLTTLAFRQVLAPKIAAIYFLALAFGAFVDVFLFYTFRLLSENLVLFLLPIFYFLIIATFRRKSIALASLAGVAMGLCALSRQNLVLLGPAIAGLLFLYLKEQPRRTLVSLVFLSGFGLAFSLLPLRNYAVTDKISVPVIWYAAQRLTSDVQINEPLTLVSVGKKLLFCAGITTAMKLPVYYLKPHWVVMWIGAFIHISRLLKRRQAEFWEAFALIFNLMYLAPLFIVPGLTVYGVRTILPVLPIVLLLAVGSLTPHSAPAGN